ncbi:MAG TPA: choice-of-anchor tandem repeat GloVer-containing protein [Bacteroidales bacterium]
MKTTILLVLLAMFVIQRSNAQFTKLIDFDGINKGSYPAGSLARSGTTLFGMTNNGGTSAKGVIFKVNISNDGFTKLLDFDDVSKGSGPTGTLILSDSVMYGMTYSGGLNSLGVLFKINTNGSGFRKVVNFDGVSKGSYPAGSPTLSGKVLYGMTELGGTNNMGVIFKVDTDGNEFKKLGDFDGVPKGSIPYGDLTLSGSTLYGMTELGGANNRGIVFKMDTDGTNFSKLVDFDGNSGSYPFGSLILAGTVLYGMTSEGGTNNHGVLFKVNVNGTGFSKLDEFADSIQHGSHPLGSLTLSGTTLFGLTAHGGIYGKGVIFKINTDGTGFTKLLDFDGTNHGSVPLGSFTLNGNVLYGMTSGGGTNSKGTVFQYVFDNETTGVMNNSFERYRIYPNPASDRLLIESEQTQINRIEMITMEGQLVKSQICHSSDVTINVADLSKGVYIIKVYDLTGGVSVNKILKQ